MALSSIAKKVIMSITGLFLILFITLHMCLNLTYVFDGCDGQVFQGVCDFMSIGLVSIMVPVLAAGFVLHILFALYLTITNRQARGSVRYAVSNKAATDSWSARNMFVLGLIVVLGIALHLTDFWSKMQLQEWTGNEAGNPYELMSGTFGNLWITILYIVWFVAIWFHLTHGFWSALQTLGWNNTKWLVRWKWITSIYVTAIILGFIVIAITAYCRTNGLCC